MNGYAEAYTAVTASWKQPVIEDNAEAVDAVIQKLYAIRKSWDDDPNPNKKEKVIRMLTSSNHAYLLQKRASMLPGDLRFEYLRRCTKTLSQNSLPDRTLEPQWPAQPNAALRQIREEETATYLANRAKTLITDEDEYTVELPYDIPAEHLQDAEISGNARLLTAKERKKIAEHPETTLGKVFRIEGRYRRGEDEVFKVNGVLLLVEDKMVYLTYPKSGKVASGTTSRLWEEKWNPTKPEDVDRLRASVIHLVVLYAFKRAPAWVFVGWDEESPIWSLLTEPCLACRPQTQIAMSMIEKAISLSTELGLSPLPNLSLLFATRSLVMSSLIPLSAEEESLISYLIQERDEVKEITERYRAELSEDMNAYAEAYIVATATMEPLIRSHEEAVEEAEIQRLHEVKKSWLADPNPNYKEKMIRFLTGSHYSGLLLMKVVRLPKHLNSEIWRRKAQAEKRCVLLSHSAYRFHPYKSKTATRDFRTLYPNWPDEPNAALLQLFAQDEGSGLTFKFAKPSDEDYSDSDDDDNGEVHDPTPYEIPTPKSLKASDVVGNARLIPDKERKKYAQNPLSCIGKIFRVPGRAAGVEEDEYVFKVRGVLHVEEQTEVYVLDLDSGRFAYGNSLDDWEAMINPKLDGDVRIYEIVKE
ncbi:hypothetical protein NMY22_g17901 [Coprinellus aureogranulatus]|nr:hypothetical protein NMY22_g17901 [Coprinellus aureogranulatus]